MSNNRISITILAMALLGVGGVACKRRNAEEPVSQPPVQRAAADDDSPVEFREPPANVHLDARIAQMCDIPTPNFAFDSAAVDSEAGAALDALATCFMTGPAKDEELRLVGHADPRGDEEYNFGLGQRRASSIAGYLQQKGLPSQRIETSSRGELDATGQDEEGYAQDRRVDILLAS